MSLFIRYKNEVVDGPGTMARHLAVVEQEGKVLWGQYSTNKTLFSIKSLKKLNQSQDKRVVFYDSQTGDVYVGQLEEIYAHTDKSWDREAVGHLVPSYYEVELGKGEDSEATAWLLLSKLDKIFRPDEYLDQIYLESDEGTSIKDALKGQGSRFYIVNRNLSEITDVDEMILEETLDKHIADYVPSPADQRKFKQAVIAYREGQRVFRQMVLSAYHYRCCISSCSVKQVLEAAHVTPYNGSESNIVTNGICLRADLHKLWDAYMIAINPETKQVEIAAPLEETDYAVYKGKKVFEGLSNPPAKNLLMIHYEQFIKHHH